MGAEGDPSEKPARPRLPNPRSLWTSSAIPFDICDSLSESPSLGRREADPKRGREINGPFASSHLGVSARRRVLTKVALAMLTVTGTFLLDTTPALAFGINQFAVSPTPSSPNDITMGSDGNLWFTDALNNAIGRILPGPGTVTEYTVQTANAGVSNIALGSDGNLWFTESTADKIGMINPSSPSTPTEYAVPTAASGPSGIAAGADGDLWFTEANAGKIGQFTPSDPSAITETPIPNCTTCDPLEIAAGSDKNLWFTEQNANKIGRIHPATHKVTQFKIPYKFGHPVSITSGSNGDLWFIEFDNENSVDIVQAMTTLGTLGPSSTFSYTDGCCGAISPGPDGDIWVAEAGGNNDVVQFTTSAGFVSLTGIPTAASAQPGGMSPGSDGNLWFTDSSQGTNGVAGNIDVIKFPNLNLLNIYYLPNRFFIPNEVNLPQQGDTASWMGLNPRTDSITDGSGMGLFGSQDSLNTIDSVYQFAFTAAGTYSYRGGAGGIGKVAVPITAQPQPQATNAAIVTWASAAPPAGFAFDEQVKTPGSASFVPWLTGTTATNLTFSPATGPYTGPGTYQFRSRIRNTANNAASGYSKPASIALS